MTEKKSVLIDLDAPPTDPYLKSRWRKERQMPSRRRGTIDLVSTELVPFMTPVQKSPPRWGQLFGTATKVGTIYDEIDSIALPVLGDAVLDAWLADTSLVPQWVYSYGIIAFWGTLYDIKDDDGTLLWSVRCAVVRNGHISGEEYHLDFTWNKPHLTTPVLKEW